MAASHNVGPVVKTSRLVLRPLEQSDATQIHRIRPHLPATDVSQTEAWVHGCLSRSNCYNFVVEELHSSTPQIIGVLGAIRTPEVGFIFHPDSWGKGYATEALAAFLPLLWQHVDPDTAPEGRKYDYSKALADKENYGSRKVLEKCGYSLVEVKLQDFDSPMLGLRDTVTYRIARPENKQGKYDV